MLQSIEIALFVRTKMTHLLRDYRVQNIVNRRINKHFDCMVCGQRQSDNHDTDQQQTVE